jgi:hypothetical protein
MMSRCGRRIVKGGNPALSWRTVLLATAVSVSARSSSTAFHTPPRITHQQQQEASTSHGTTNALVTRRWFSSKIDDDDDVNNGINDNNKLNPRDVILQKAPKEDQVVIERTLDWVQRVVIGLNLCPFADKPLQQGNLHIDVVEGTDQVEILSHLLAECLVRQTNPGTSLIVCPDLFPANFRSFLEVYNMLQDGVLVDHDLTDDLQVAPFHPFFEFEGSRADDIDNWTNRSPYPIFHILREEEVSFAVDALQGDASKVWKRNVQLMEQLEQELDSSQVEQLLKGQPQRDEDRQKVNEILQGLKKRE